MVQAESRAALSSTAPRTRWTLQPVVERRGRLPVLRDGGDQVDDLMGEAVLVAETVPGRPPGTHVRVLGLGDQDPPKALLLDRLRAVEELQQVVVLEVEGERAVGAVDLDPQRVLATEGEAGGLERADRAVGEPRGEQRRVVHGDLAPRSVPAGIPVTAQSGALTAQRPRRHERLQDRGDAGDRLPGQPLGGVDQVGADVAQRAGPRLRSCPAARSSGASGSCSQSCRYWARTWRTLPIRPSSTSWRARASAGVRAVGEAAHGAHSALGR